MTNKITTWELGREDIRFLEGGFKISNFLGIAPSFNFNEGLLKHPRMSKIYSVFISIFYIMITIVTFWLREQGFMSKISAVLNYLCDFTLVILSLSLTFGTIYNLENWKMLLTLLNNDSKYFTKNMHCKKINMYYVQLIIAHCMFSVCYSADIYLWISVMSHNFFSQYFVMIIFHYCELHSVCLMGNILSSITLRYKDLEKQIISLTRNHNVQGLIILINKRYIELNRILDIFNKIFGWPLLFVILYIFLQIINCTSLIIGANFYDELLPFVLMNSFFLAIAVTFGTVYLILECDSARLAGMDIALSFYRVSDHFAPGSKEKEELFKSEYHARKFLPRISAAGFFDISKKTILDIIGAITTYLIVIIQFYGFHSIK